MTLFLLGDPMQTQDAMDGGTIGAGCGGFSGSRKDPIWEVRGWVGEFWCLSLRVVMSESKALLSLSLSPGSIQE